MSFSLEEIGRRVGRAAVEYNSQAAPDERIVRVSVFGSYAEGAQGEGSDVDLLVAFSSPVVGLFSLARVLDAMEEHVGLPVDVVQDPLPEDALLTISSKVLVYEAA